MVTAWVPWLSQPVCFPNPQLRWGRRLVGLHPAHKATNPESVTRVILKSTSLQTMGGGGCQGLHSP